MNLYINIGYSAKDISTEVINELSHHLPNQPSSHQDLVAALQHSKINVMMQSMKALPFYSDADEWIIAALLPRIQYASSYSIRDFIPESHQGIFGLICLKSEVSLRKHLASFNDEQTMFCSNVERTIVREINPTKVHCHVDRANRYNLGIELIENQRPKQYFYSQTTFVGLAENALKEINKQ